MTRRQPPRLVSRAVDFRAVADTGESGDGRTLEGYAAVFNTPTEINSWEGVFSEQIAYGAFRKTLRERTPVLQFDHGRDMRTGSVPIGSFESLSEDETGLHVVARLFDNPVVDPIRQAIEGGAISGMSFRFEIMRDEWRDTETDKLIKADDLFDRLWTNDDPAKILRTIKEVRLFEAGPVVFPAYAETSVGVRMMMDRITSDPELIEALRRELDKNQAGHEPAKVYPAREDRPTPDRESTSEPIAPTPDRESTSGQPPAETTRTQPVSKKKGTPVDLMTTEERRARLGEIRSRLTEIDTEYAGAELPEEIRSEWDGLTEEYELHERSITAADERRARLARMAENANQREDTTRYSVRPGVRKTDDPFDLNGIRNLARSFEELPSLYRDHAMRAVEAGRFPGVEDREKAQGQVARLLDSIDDERGTLARRILITGSPVYERAFGKAVLAANTLGLTQEERAAMSLGTDTAGGFAVPYMLDPSVILTSDGVINPLRRIARVVQIVGKEWQGLTSAGITVSRDSESEEVSDDGPSFAQPTVRTVKVQGFVPFTIELEMDWASMRSELTMMLNDAKEVEEGTSFVLGTGSGNAPGGVVGSLDYATCQVDAGGSFTSADLFAIEEDLPVRWRGRASWLANKSIYNRVRGLGAASDGGDLWVRLGQGLPPELIGYSAYEASAMTTTVAGTNDRALVFGDFSQFLIVDRIGMSVELVPHLLATGNNRPNGQRGLYAYWRNNSKVLVQNAFRFLANMA